MSRKPSLRPGATAEDVVWPCNGPAVLVRDELVQGVHREMVLAEFGRGGGKPDRGEALGVGRDHECAGAPARVKQVAVYKDAVPRVVARLGGTATATPIPATSSHCVGGERTTLRRNRHPSCQYNDKHLCKVARARNLFEAESLPVLGDMEDVRWWWWWWRESTSRAPWLAADLLLSNEARRKRASLQRSVAFPRSPKCTPCANFRSHTFEKGMGGCTTASRSSNGGGCTARLSPKSGRPVGWTAAAVNTRDVRREGGLAFGFGCSTSKDTSSQHREFVKVGPNGSLEDIEEIVQCCLKKIGEGDAPQLIFSPQKR
ncbi:hypothetical protein B0H14DRAFT_3649907 [Mycena olivaceomarginata]|nr:hypothetical protein B0H14DRAFT_3649907 [Mycena olivaceomarginata]